MELMTVFSAFLKTHDQEKRGLRAETQERPVVDSPSYPAFIIPRPPPGQEGIDIMIFHAQEYLRKMEKITEEKENRRSISDFDIEQVQLGMLPNTSNQLFVISGKIFFGYYSDAVFIPE